MAGATAPTAVFNPLRDLTGDLDSLKRNEHIVRKSEPGLAHVDAEIISDNAKKYADQNQDIAKMNFKDWLELTIASFQNQDPMNPKDPSAVATEFATIGMTVGFSEARRDIEKMLNVMNKGMSLSASGKVGQEVEAQFNAFKYNGTDDVKLGFDLPVNAAKVEITILDENAQYTNKIILEDGGKFNINGKDEIVDLKLGRNNIYWNGLKNNDTPAEKGKYTFKVRAYDADNTPLKDPKTNKPYQLRQYVTGTLEASFIDSSNNPKVQVDGIEMPFDAIKKLSGKRPQNAPSSPAFDTPQMERPMPNAPIPTTQTKAQSEQERWDAAREPLFQRYADEDASPAKMHDDIIDVMRRFNLDVPRRPHEPIPKDYVGNTSTQGFHESPF